MAESINPDYFREKLFTLREETQAALAQAEESVQPVALDQTAVGRVSRIDAIQQQEMALAAKRRREVILPRIEQALERIETGNYGYCQKCDEPIVQKRLELDPLALVCIDCAKLNE